MTVTAAEGLPARALPGERDEQVHDERPAAGAPGEARNQVEVRLQPAPSGSRGHTVTVLFCLAGVQLAWLAALLYGAYALLR